MPDPQHVLTLSCPNRPGIVAAVASLIAAGGGDILEAQQFDDAEATGAGAPRGRFFMRVVLAHPAAGGLRDGLPALASRFGMDWSLRDRAAPRRVLLMASRFDHCLVDLLYRQRIGELPMTVTAVVSNHPREVYGSLDLNGAAFHHLPVTADTKPAQEAALRRIIDGTGTELVVLARYMQVLSAELSAALAGRCINIHHSFLPGFKGARPYHAAHARGVKLIGATAHYVTPDLDEGPIIEQDVERVTHNELPDDLIRVGRDVERRVLARAVRWHLEDRVLLNGRRTVVFRS